MPSRKTKEQQIQTALGFIEALFREMLPAVPKEFLDMDISMPQLKTVIMLYMNGPTRMSRLASDLGVTLATTTGLVDRMVDRGLVTRLSDPADRRVVLCSLTHLGTNMVSIVWDSSRDKCREMLGALSYAQLNDFNQISQAMADQVVQNKISQAGRKKRKVKKS